MGFQMFWIIVAVVNILVVSLGFTTYQKKWQITGWGIYLFGSLILMDSTNAGFIQIAEQIQVVGEIVIASMLVVYVAYYFANKSDALER